MERGEGRSGLKARLRRWVGTSTSRQKPREARPMEERGHHIHQEASERHKLSIDSGIGLEPLRRMPTTKLGMEGEQSLESVHPTPILRSTRKRCGVKKSISFSDGHSRTLRYRSQLHSSAQPVLGGRRHETNILAEIKFWSPDFASSWPRKRTPPEKVQISGWCASPPSGSVGPQLGTIYGNIFAQVKASAPDLSPLTMDFLFNPTTKNLSSRIDALSSSQIGLILSDLSILIFPGWVSLKLQPHEQGVLLHLLHLLLSPLFKDAEEASGLALLAAACRKANYKDIELSLAATRHLFLTFWKRLLHVE